MPSIVTRDRMSKVLSNETCAFFIPNKMLLKQQNPDWNVNLFLSWSGSSMGTF